MESDLQRALERQEFRTYYQPTVSLTTGRPAGCEALVRWQHPERGLLAPAAFMPLAEGSGLDLPIGWWVLHDVSRQVRHWRQLPHMASLTVNVNVSSTQFAHPELIAQCERALSTTGRDETTIGIEIHEFILLENVPSAPAILSGLKALGVSLLIDDVSASCAALVRQHRDVVDTLKIDRSFVIGPDTRGVDAEAIGAVVALAHGLGMDVIAEGVETEAQLSHLKALGCDYGQGFLFSRPLDAEAMSKWIAAWSHD